VNIQEAQQQHTGRQSAVSQAQADLDNAKAARAAAEQAAVEAEPEQLDAAVKALATAEGKVSIADKRLALALARLAAAEADLKNAELAEAEKAVPVARQQLVEAGAHAQEVVLDLVKGLELAWKQLASAKSAFESAYYSAQAAKNLDTSLPPPLPELAALAVMKNGKLDVIASTAALVAFVADAPRREMERKQAERQAEAEQLQRDLNGYNGIAAQDEAREKAKESEAALGWTRVGNNLVRAPFPAVQA